MDTSQKGFSFYFLFLYFDVLSCSTEAHIGGKKLVVSSQFVCVIGRYYYEILYLFLLRLTFPFVFIHGELLHLDLDSNILLPKKEFNSQVE